MASTFIKRDISWLSFSRRILMEASDMRVPLVEKIKFLSIFSSNLDEFYSVRFPILMALKKMNNEDAITDSPPAIKEINGIIEEQMKDFGSIIHDDIIPGLRAGNTDLYFNQPIPEFLQGKASDYFYNRVLGYLQPVFLSGSPTSFLIQNNKLYLVAALLDAGKKQHIAIINVPTDFMPRFYFIDDHNSGTRYIFFLEDIIKHNLDKIFPGYFVESSFAIKITRDASLDLQDEFHGDIASKIEKQLQIREFGLPTRFLYAPGVSPKVIGKVVKFLGLEHANIVEGGNYHHLRDLAALPIPDHPYFKTDELVPKSFSAINSSQSIFDWIKRSDLMIHTPYQSYAPVLRFFNEAANDPLVRKIYVTIYRIASNSQITNALISAAKNGKKVTVFMELKARFDEENNLKWAKKLKNAGVKIIYSLPGLKVHAKIALVKRKEKKKLMYYGLFSTGNFNENTAKFYTDHILLSANQRLTAELDSLFSYLVEREKTTKSSAPKFKQLLVAQFNLYDKFSELIQREIRFARKGKLASIVIKLNNLEEKSLIEKLYEASSAGVNIQLIVRGICCLMPAVPGMSENITVTRIVDRYLEHGRIFIFHNDGAPEYFIGSSDWMNRNIHHRIEVCFPIYDGKIREQIARFIQVQLADNTKAVNLNEEMKNCRVTNIPGAKAVRSQEEIYHLM